MLKGDFKPVRGKTKMGLNAIQPILSPVMLFYLVERGDSSSSSYRPPHPADTYAASDQAPTHTGTVSDNNEPTPDSTWEEPPF